MNIMWVYHRKTMPLQNAGSRLPDAVTRKECSLLYNILYTRGIYMKLVFRRVSAAICLQASCTLRRTCWSHLYGYRPARYAIWSLFVRFYFSRLLANIRVFVKFLITQSGVRSQFVVKTAFLRSRASDVTKKRDLPSCYYESNYYNYNPYRVHWGRRKIKPITRIRLWTLNDF